MENPKEKVKRTGKARAVCSRLVAPFKELYHVFKDDIGLKMLLSDTKATLKKAGSFVLGNAMALPFYILGHESMHAVSYKLLGKGVDYLGVRKELGGGILEKILPFISTNVTEFNGNLLGGAGSFLNGTPLESIVGSFAPFTATPLGIILMRKAKKHRSLFGEGIGFLIATAPFRNLYDFNSVSGSLGLEGITKHLIAGALMASTYIGSYYAANGLEFLLGKLKRKRNEKAIEREKCEKDESPGRCKRFLTSASHVAAVALVSLGLAYAGQPDCPIRISQKQRAEIQTLYNMQQYEKAIEIIQKEPKVSSRRHYFNENMEILAYAGLVATGQRTEDIALLDIAPEFHNKFYFHLMLHQVTAKDYPGARKTSEKIDLSKLDDKGKQTFDAALDFIIRQENTKSF